MWELVTKAVTSSSPLEQSVLYLLIAFSIVSWAIIFMKIKAISAAKKNNDKLLEAFEQADRVDAVSAPAAVGPAPMTAVIKAANQTMKDFRQLAASNPQNFEEKVHQSMQHTSKSEFLTIRWGLGFLASVASASPFIGLFGTVWGIMATFQNLGDSKSASLAVVAPGISAALIATAMGLAVAIPAVMAYNALLAKIDELQEKTDIFIERVDLMVRTTHTSASAPVASKARSVEKPVAVAVQQ
jgi:biopolymer transport protein TolQ